MKDETAWELNRYLYNHMDSYKDELRQIVCKSCTLTECTGSDPTCVAFCFTSFPEIDATRILLDLYEKEIERRGIK